MRLLIAAIFLLFLFVVYAQLSTAGGGPGNGANPEPPATPWAHARK